MGPKKTFLKKDGDRCFFCKKKGHMKKECAKFKAWMSKRGLTGNDSLILVCESNLSEAPPVLGGSIVEQLIMLHLPYRDS